ncbi:hypothetical protein Syun_011747 [Stephania yunnanensis]|uniref:Uncharacterized protein n=1 Tax=Stephania yunnanensis TaxID=152371 RepID=A0AAP0JY61_9MAGN
MFREAMKQAGKDRLHYRSRDASCFIQHMSNPRGYTICVWKVGASGFHSILVLRDRGDLGWQSFAEALEGKWEKEPIPKGESGVVYPANGNQGPTSASGAHETRPVPSESSWVPGRRLYNNEGRIELDGSPRSGHDQLP